MKFKLLISSFVLIVNILTAQDKRAYSWVFGGGGMYASFADSNAAPTTHQLNTVYDSKYDYFFAHSNICDSSTGRILFTCSNGMRLFDTLGNLIENGDSLQPAKIFSHNSPPDAVNTQGSLILPKGSNGLYYIFTPTITDSSYNYWITQVAKAPFNLLQYHIVDMNANNGAGKVIQKNIPLLTNVEMHKVGMMACRHANGYDWWLLKQANYDSNVIYKILVTADTVIVKDTQVFANPVYGVRDRTGQSAFSKNGKKYAYSMGPRSQLFLADFNRCTGMLTNYKIINVPIDSTTDPFYDNQGIFDSLVSGISFSSNDSFLYVAIRYNLYQYNLFKIDSNLAWTRIIHGSDTTFQAFGGYGQLYRAIDNKIYVGQASGTFGGLSVINNPNKLGLACQLCKKCLRYNQGFYSPTAPANMPDFNLGADSSSCWPLSNVQLAMSNEQLKVYPNPANSVLYIQTSTKQKRELYNYTGQLLFTTAENKIDVSKYPRGLYFVKCGAEVIKVVLE